MPNAINANGLTTATQTELVNNFTAAFELIYGNDIDLDPDSPDGQMMMIFIQAVLDLEDLITQVYNMFDPDNAIGVILDQRVAINGIQRQAGTFTVVNITIATSQSVNLYGIDQTVQPVFTVSDNSGNQYELQVTHTGFNPGGGGSSLVFQAVNPGALSPTPNTITVPVTIVLGVTSINNPTGATTVGINEETDAQLKVRRQQSVSLASQGYLPGLLAALKNITGMVAAFVYENNTDATNGDGVPSHSIWVITSGTALDADIAQVIYDKRNAGCGMFGTTSYVITQVDGSFFTVSWTKVSLETLYIKFNVGSINGTGIPNIAGIRSGLVTTFLPGVNEEVNVNELATLVQAIDSNTLVTSPGFDISSGGGFANLTLSPATKDKQFSITAPNIIILPMILVAAGGTLIMSAGNVVSTATVANLGTIVFTSLGGFGTDHSGSVPHLTYSIFSGSGSIVSATGVFTANGTGTTVVRVTDALGNIANCTVTVT